MTHSLTQRTLVKLKNEDEKKNITIITNKMTKTKFSLFLLLSMLNASISVKAQTADTLSVGMELRLQNTISENIFMYDTSSDGFKGIPTDTASFHLYKQNGVVCIIARDSKRKDWYSCAFDMDKDKDFSNDYHYYFTRNQIYENRMFTPQRYGDVWVAPNICLNGIAKRGGGTVVRSRDAFDEFVPMFSIHTFCVGSFDYHGKNYYISSAYNKTEFAITDSIPKNSDDLARMLVDNGLLREVKFPIIRDSLIFRFHDFDFSRQQCRISITPLTDETIPVVPFEGFRAPAISVKDINDKSVALGKGYTLLDFWGTWCNPCIALVAELVDIHKHYPALNLISIASEGSMDDMPKLKKLIKEHNMDWTHVCQLRNDASSVVNSFNVTAFPTTILIDSSGKILYRASGNNKTDKLKAKLREIFGE